MDGLNTIQQAKQHQMKEFLTISEFYGTRTAQRSRVPLMNHITEGLVILDTLQASDLVKKAFCLHPIVQNNEDVDVSWSEALPLAQEYRDRANAYLCRPETDWVSSPIDLRMLVSDMSEGCRLMLLADKVQNEKDFILYHADTHPRKDQLRKYFRIWIQALREHYRGDTK